MRVDPEPLLLVPDGVEESLVADEALGSYLFLDDGVEVRVLLTLDLPSDALLLIVHKHHRPAAQVQHCMHLSVMEEHEEEEHEEEEHEEEEHEEEEHEEEEVCAIFLALLTLVLVSSSWSFRMGSMRRSFH